MQVLSPITGLVDVFQQLGCCKNATAFD